jgi:hypothetical protein
MMRRINKFKVIPLQVNYIRKNRSKYRNGKVFVIYEFDNIYFLSHIYHIISNIILIPINIHY